MAANRVDKFIELVDERDTKMAEHCKNQSWAELCNYPEERDWYTKNIYPIDEQIVEVANAIIVKFSIPCRKAKTIAEVYSNQWIMRLVEKQKECVEAVPGPAIVISKETYEKMQANDSSKENKERLERYRGLINNIVDNTKKDDGDEFSL